MNLQDLSNTLLEEAITKGTITLENRVIRLTGSQIISVLRYIHGKNIIQENIQEGNVPIELFIGSKPTPIELSVQECDVKINPYEQEEE